METATGSPYAQQPRHVWKTLLSCSPAQSLALPFCVMMVFEFWEERHVMDVSFRLKHPSFLFSTLWLVLSLCTNCHLQQKDASLMS